MDDPAAGDDDPDVANRGDVGGGIIADEQQVGVEPGVQPAGPADQSACPCGQAGRRRERGRRGDSAVGELDSGQRKAVVGLDRVDAGVDAADQRDSAPVQLADPRPPTCARRPAIVKPVRSVRAVSAGGGSPRKVNPGCRRRT